MEMEINQSNNPMKVYGNLYDVRSCVSCSTWTWRLLVSGDAMGAVIFFAGDFEREGNGNSLPDMVKVETKHEGMNI